MTPEALIGAGLMILLLALLGLGLWVPFALVLVAGAALAGFSSAPLGEVMATAMWSASSEWALAALPMFIWMGEILFRSRLSSDLFAGLAPWVGRLPGGLVHVNVLGCGLFAAVSGSSAATCATVGKMTLPELARRGYCERLALGSLAGSATLGLLIPPSIILIVYGVAVDESVARLFLAGLLPGLMLIGLFSGYVALAGALRPDRAPAERSAAQLGERLRGARRLAPITVLMVAVIGSIYAGLASPTDAAALGVLCALLLVWRAGDLTRSSFSEGLLAATRTACMIAFILIAAAFLTAAMGFTGLPRALAGWIGGLGLSTTALLAALTLFFIALGCFLDGVSIVVLTTAVILPMVEQAGIDRIWFGVFLVLVVEMSQITPPVGFNLFVIQNLTGRNVLAVAWAAAPFFLLLLLAVALLVLFPGLATWLPSVVFGP